MSLHPQDPAPRAEVSSLPADQHALHAEVEEADSAEGVEHEKTLRAVFRERRIALTTMSGPLRLIVGLAVAQLLAAALLVAARTNLSGTIAIASQDNMLIQMPTVAFAVSVLFLALAWSYLLTGALQTPPWPVGLVTLALFTLSMHEVSAPGAAGLVLDALLVAMWVVGLAIWLRTGRGYARGRASQGDAPAAGTSEAAPGVTAEANASMSQPLLDRQTRALAFGILLALILAYYGVAWWRNLAAGIPRGFTFALTVQLEVLSFFLIPVLFLAGTDFAEWGELIAERISSVAGARRSPWVMFGLTASTALVVLAGLVTWSLHPLHRSDLPPLLQSLLPPLPPAAAPLALAESTLLGAVAIGILALIGSYGRLRSTTAAWKGAGKNRVPYAALAIGAIVLLGTTILIAASVVVAAAHQPASQADTGFTTYRHADFPPEFSLKYPGRWSVTPILNKGASLPTIIVFNGALDHDPAQFTVVAYPRAALLNEATWGPSDFFAQLYPRYKGQYTAVPAEGPWQVTQFTLDRPDATQLTGIAWQRIEGDQYWLLYGFAPSAYFGPNVPVFRTMVGTWQPSTPLESAQQTAAPTLAEQFLKDRLPGLALGVLPLLLAIVVGMPLLTRWQRGQVGPLAAAGLFVAVAGVLQFLEFLPEVAKLFSLPGEHVPALSLSGIQAAVALGTAGYLVWMAARRQITSAMVEPLGLLFVLNGALLFIAAMVNVYAVARTEARFTVVQAIVLLAALLWDTLMSGEEITNVEGAIFPRHTRVLLFLGYIMLVSSAVLYFSSWQMQATNASAEPFFESEQWPQYGLVGLGVPLVIAGFMMRMGRNAAERNAASG